jgi:ectoine hydroxylase-related dioxygenase (phytanoyl-CoA dioxygenase family)
MDEQIAFLKKNGYVVIPAALSATEVVELNQALDIDRQKYPQLWPERGEGGRSQSVSVLLTSTAFDCTIRHPAVLPLLEALMGEELCFAELSVMVRAPLDQEPSPPVWHRDKENWPEHPLALHNISAVYYLTDVDASTHCFGVVPEGLEAKMASPTDRDGTNGVELYGRAGTVILFNAGSVHAGVVRRTVRDRRTIHIYYGHRSQPPLSNHTIFPRRLLEAKDEAIRLFYSRPNLMTQLMCDNF